MILLSSTRTLGSPISEALQAAGVPFAEPRPDPFVDSEVGRFGYSLLRVVRNEDDFVAIRVLLGLHRGVGVATCRRIADAVIGANVTLKEIVSLPLPHGLFTGRALRAVDDLRSSLAVVQGWSMNDRWDLRRDDISDVIETAMGAEQRHEWEAELVPLVDEATLGEVLAFISTADDAGRERVLGQIAARLGEAEPPQDEAGRVRVMTMHGSKGLSAKVVFIPGLEEDLIPSRQNAGVPGLVAEGARLLFVSISRARAACIVSFSTRRRMQGGLNRRRASRYAAPLGVWVPRQQGLTNAEAHAIIDDVTLMRVP